MKLNATVEKKINLNFNPEEIAKDVVLVSVDDIVHNVEFELENLVNIESSGDVDFYDLDESIQNEMYAKVLEQVIAKLPKTWKEYLNESDQTLFSFWRLGDGSPEPKYYITSLHKKSIHFLKKFLFSLFS